MDRKGKGILTSTVASDAVDLTIVAHLEETRVALTASAIVTTVPSTADAVAVLPLCYVRADLDHFADDLVTRNTRKLAKAAGLDHCVRVADTTRFDLDEDLTITRCVQLDVLDGERLACLFEHGRLVGLGKRRHVCAICPFERCGGRVWGDVASGKEGFEDVAAMTVISAWHQQEAAPDSQSNKLASEIQLERTDAERESCFSGCRATSSSST